MIPYIIVKLNLIVITNDMNSQLLNRLKLMGVFCHVVEAGSMREAAAKLGISPPAVSQFINQLESELDVTLLYRSTRRINVSEAGEKFYLQSKKMLAAAEQAEEVIHQSRSAISGELRIALPVGLAAKPAARALAPLFKEHKELKLSLIASDETVDLIDEGIDIVIDCGEAKDSSYIYHQLGKATKVICASPKYLQQYGNPVTPRELSDHTWLGLGEIEAKGVLNQVVLHHAKSAPASFKPALRYVFNDLNALISHVQEGLGIAQLPTLEIQHLIDNGELVPLLPDWQIEKHNVYALTRDKKYTYKVQAALAALKHYFGNIES